MTFVVTGMNSIDQAVRIAYAIGNSHWEKGRAQPPEYWTEETLKDIVRNSGRYLPSELEHDFRWAYFNAKYLFNNPAEVGASVKVCHRYEDWTMQTVTILNKTIIDAALGKGALFAGIEVVFYAKGELTSTYQDLEFNRRMERMLKDVQEQIDLRKA